MTILHDFYAFAKAKPADEAYNYHRFNGPCAVEQFRISRGEEYECPIVHNHEAPETPEEIMELVAVEGIHTWSKLAKRLERFL